MECKQTGEFAHSESTHYESGEAFNGEVGQHRFFFFIFRSLGPTCHVCASPYLSDFWSLVFSLSSLLST